MVEEEVQLFGELVQRMERLLESDVYLQRKLVAAGDWLSAENETDEAHADAPPPLLLHESSASLRRGSVTLAGEMDSRSTDTRSTAAMLASAASMAVMSGQAGVGLHVPTPALRRGSSGVTPPALGAQRSWLIDAEAAPAAHCRKIPSEASRDKRSCAV